MGQDLIQFEYGGQKSNYVVKNWIIVNYSEFFDLYNFFEVPCVYIHWISFVKTLHIINWKVSMGQDLIQFEYGGQKTNYVVKKSEL